MVKLSEYIRGKLPEVAFFSCRSGGKLQGRAERRECGRFNRPHSIGSARPWSLPPERLLCQYTVKQLLEVAQAIFAVQHQPALVEEAGGEAALDRLTEYGILLLHLVDELREVLLFLRGNLIDEAVLEDGQGFVDIDGQEKVEREVTGAGIDVEGKIGPQISIEAFFNLAAGIVQFRLAVFAGLFFGTALRGEVFVLGDYIVIDINDRAKARMSDRAVIALQVVVHHD